MNLACNVFLSLLQNTPTIFHHMFLAQVLQSLLLVIWKFNWCQESLKNLLTPQDIFHIVNLETTNNLCNNKEIDYVIVELTKIVKLCFNHPHVLLLLGCPHCDVHACWEMNLIQHHRLDFHICVLYFKLHFLCSRRQRNFKFVLPHCWFQALFLVIIKFFIPQHKNHVLGA